jgi:hypothetical protein
MWTQRVCRTQRSYVELLSWSALGPCLWGLGMMTSMRCVAVDLVETLCVFAVS